MVSLVQHRNSFFIAYQNLKKKCSTSYESQSTNIFMPDNNLSLHNKLCISREFLQIEGLHIFQNCELFFLCSMRSVVLLIHQAPAV